MWKEIWQNEWKPEIVYEEFESATPKVCHKSNMQGTWGNVKDYITITIVWSDIMYIWLDFDIVYNNIYNNIV